MTLSHQVTFDFPAGQDPNGAPYVARKESGYLPVNDQGTTLLELFKVAFLRRVMFGLGLREKNQQYAPIFCIKLKTKASGGRRCFGWPDDGYFRSAVAELKAQGVGIRDIADHQQGQRRRSGAGGSSSAAAGPSAGPKRQKK